MLKTYPDASAETLEGACWIDLRDPTEEDVKRIDDRYGIDVPSREALSEIEVSSRLRIANKTIYMSAPVMAKMDDGFDRLTPTGFILSEKVLVTVRFADSGAFDAVHDELGRGGHPVTPVGTLAQLLEEIVDRAADRIERAADEINKASHEVFTERHGRQEKQLGRETKRLRGLMMGAGRTSEQLVRVRHSILSIARITAFILDRCEFKLDEGLRERMTSVGHDIESLQQFEESLAGRIQLLLDAATGFLSIDQNDVVKVLTVVSTAGVPPVLIAGIYGMNFKYMPELSWPWGYPFATALMVLSTALPVLWFKWRDWL